MKTMLRTSLLGLLAVRVLCYGALSQAYTIEEVEKAGNYEGHVAKNMRELVPGEKYKTVSRELSELRDPIGGTGLSCVLMPNTYHHFHSPVNGKIAHAEIVRSGTYG